jgi:PhnB protein
MAAKSTPDGYHSVTPYLTIRGADAAMKFYAAAFGAEVTCRLDMPDGSVAHAEFRIGDSVVMLADENPAWGSTSPQSLGGVTGGVMLYVPDADAAFERALAAGATVKFPLADQFYGDRSGRVVDPFGHHWTLSTRVEEVPLAEMQARMDAWLAGMAQAA